MGGANSRLFGTRVQQDIMQAKSTDKAEFQVNNRQVRRAAARRERLEARKAKRPALALGTPAI